MLAVRSATGGQRSLIHLYEGRHHQNKRNQENGKQQRSADALHPVRLV
jgi:hypothetical protein